MDNELKSVARSVVDLAKALGETPCAEILKLAGDGEEPVAEVSPEQDAEFPTARVMGLLAKGLTALTGEMQTLKAGRYPYPGKDKDEEEEEEKKKAKGPTTADVLTAIEKLTTSVTKLASSQSTVTKADAKKQEEEETEEEAAARKKKEEEEKEKEKEAVKLSADGTPEKIEAAEETSEPAIDELVKAQVDKRLEETLQRMGFLKSGASVIPVGAAERPGLLSKGGQEQTIEDVEKFSKLSFREMNEYRMKVGGFNQN